MSSQITHTQLFNIHHLAHILSTFALIFSICTQFTAYFNHSMKRHPTALQLHHSAGELSERSKNAEE